MRQLRPLWLPLLGLLVAACGDDSATGTISRPTLVSVDPATLAGVACADAPGALRQYVATLADTSPFFEAAVVSDELCESQCSWFTASGEFVAPADDQALTDHGQGGAGNAAAGTAGATALDTTGLFRVCATVCDWIPLASSPPTDCSVGVGFGFVTPGHRYVARIDGYDRDDLLPAVVGEPQLVDPATGTPVQPRWVWLCEDPAIAIRSWTTYPRGCRLLSPAGGSAETVVEISTPALLGTLTCGQEPDQVERLELRLDDDPTVLQAVTCGETAVFAASAAIELQEGLTYTFTAAAFSAGSDVPSHVGTCAATARRGVVIRANCEALTPVDGAENR